MRTLCAAAVMAVVPMLAAAQDVPAVRQVNMQSAGNQQVLVPAGMPPKPQILSPSAKLLPKEAAAAQMSERWRNRPERPERGEDGALVWTFGLSQPSVVCAPLQLCDISLQPGEIVNNIMLGDKVRWEALPAISGAGMTRALHITIKAHDAGLNTIMMVYTDRRTYAIKLISTQQQFTGLTRFSYPEDQTAAWEAYRSSGAMAAAAAAGDSGGRGMTSAENLLFYSITGDSPSWRPTHAYSDGIKTYIQFPETMASSSAPVLVGISNDGSWFSDASEQMVTYRQMGNRYVVDGVLDHAELVVGVGSSQTKVDIRRAR